MKQEMNIEMTVAQKGYIYEFLEFRSAKFASTGLMAVSKSLNEEGKPVAIIIPHKYLMKLIESTKEDTEVLDMYLSEVKKDEKENSGGE